MGKYRLQSRNKNSMITLMEVDTECRAWYIKADDRNAAIRALRDMGKEILPVESIYINGEDVSDEVFSSIAIHMGAPVDQGPSDPMPSGEAGMDSIPLPDEEPLENYALPPDDVPLPSLDDIPPEAAPLPPEAESVPEMDMPDILPDLTSVLPKSAFVPSPKDGGKKGGSNGIYLGRKHITGDPVEIRTITDEADGVIFTGTVISSEVRELRSKKKLFLMRLADDSNGIPCKKFFDHPEDAEGVESLKPGTVVKVRGNVRFDKYSGGLTLELQQMEKGKPRSLTMRILIPRPGWNSIFIPK